MTKNLLGFATVALLFLVVGSSIAQQGTGTGETDHDLNQMLEQVLRVSESIKAERAKLESAQTSLAEERQRLTDTKSLLTSAIENAEADINKWNTEREEYNAAVDKHNAKSPCYYPEGRPEVCDPFVEEGRRLKTWKARLEESKTTLDERAGKIAERAEGFRRSALDWQERNQRNVAALAEMKVKEASLMETVRRLTLDERFLNDLRLRRILSDQCRGMTNLVEAHRCLQSIYDGARRSVGNWRAVDAGGKVPVDARGVEPWRKGEREAELKKPSGQPVQRKRRMPQVPPPNDRR